MEIAFPYSPRPGQSEIVEVLSGHIADHRHSAVQSGTGTGKTVCALSASLENCAGTGCKVIYLTRTNSQQKQVMTELRALSAKRQVFGVAIQGRRNMCPYIDINEELKSGTHEELSLLCGQKKGRVVNGDPDACKFYHTLISTDCSAVENWARNRLPTAEEFASHCSERGICPYELSKRLAESATVVTAPYIYFFDQFIRKSLLEWMGCRLSDLIVVIDEAHNLPEFARELKTYALSIGVLKSAEREALELRDPEVTDGTSAVDLLKMIQETLLEAVGEFVIEEDGLVPSGLLEEALMGKLRLTSRGVLKVAGEFVNLGEIIRDKRRKEGRLPRSYLHGVGAFLEFWMTVVEEEYVKLVVGGENPRLEAYCMDPSIACASLRETSSSIHMSGTLEPLEEYRDSIGLPDGSPLLRFPSPFPKDNLSIMYAQDVTSRYEDLAKDGKNLAKMQGYLTGIVGEFDRNTAVFFPSYKLLEKFIENGLLSKIDRPVFKEERGMAQDDLMDVVSGFKKCENGGLLLAVSGGRISEGIDFPDKELEIAIIVGIPYPKPSARTRALQHYYELKFGKGWDYVVKAPATRKMLQSIGRLIRSETDRGAALILDKRALHFKPLIDSHPSDDPVSEIRAFFEGKKNEAKMSVPRRKSPRVKKFIADPSRRLKR
jgi:DNA excision repair protein ERCC-2